MAAITQMPNGKFRVQLRRTGFQRTGTFSTQAEAEEAAKTWDIQAEQTKHGGFTPIPAKVTFHDLVERFRLDVPEKGQTHRYAITVLDRELGSLPLARLNAATLNEWVAKRRKQGTGGSSLGVYLSALRSVLNFGRYSRRLDINPDIAKDARMNLRYAGVRTVGGTRSRIPTNAELSALFSYWKEVPRKTPMELIVRIALATGWRLGEVVNLKIEDIDHESRSVWIRQRKDPRFKTDQKVPFLSAWELVKPLIDGKKSGRVFPGVLSGTVSTAFTRTCKYLEIHDLHLHDTRRAALTNFSRLGLSILEVQVCSGHKTLSQVQRYTALTADDVTRKFEALTKKPARRKKEPA